MDESPITGLTMEDEARRRRRRERNKIAATKCRLKKREKTVNLVHESQVLANLNEGLRCQIEELEVERDGLLGVLLSHKGNCVKEQSSPFQQQRTMFTC